MFIEIIFEWHSHTCEEVNVHCIHETTTASHRDYCGLPDDEDEDDKRKRKIQK
jgi:hypothetical protein